MRYHSEGSSPTRHGVYYRLTCTLDMDMWGVHLEPQISIWDSYLRLLFSPVQHTTFNK